MHPLPEAHLSVTENKEELTSRALAILTAGAGVDEKVPSLLCVRKGKVLAKISYFLSETVKFMIISKFGKQIWKCSLANFYKLANL